MLPGVEGEFSKEQAVSKAEIDPKMHAFIENAEDSFRRKLYGNRSLIFINDIPYHVDSKVYGVSRSNMEGFLRELKKRKIIEPLLEKNLKGQFVPSLNAESFGAVCALVYTITDHSPFRGPKGLTKIPYSEESFSWGELVEQTKRSLGSDPHAELLHQPQEPEPPKEKNSPGIIKSPSPLTKRLSEQTLDNNDIKPGDQEVAPKPMDVSKKFPPLDEYGYRALAYIRLNHIENYLNVLPKAAETVDFNRYVPFDVVRAVMFVLKTHIHSLSTYQPDEDIYSTSALHLGLNVCKRYLERPDIVSLDHLVVKASQAVIKEPDRYWSSPYRTPKKDLGFNPLEDHFILTDE